MDKKFETFTNNVNTTKQLYQLMEAIEEAEGASFGISKGGIKRLQGKFPEGVWRVLEELEKNSLIRLSQGGRAGYLQELQDYLAKLPKIKIEFAFDPSKEFTDKVSEFINRGSEEKIILDITVKPEILAGATIEFNGIFKDYSYKDKLSEVLRDKFKGGL